MADLLIKGMKMPKSCLDCNFNPHITRCHALSRELDPREVGNGRHKDCPLVEVEQVPLNSGEDAMRLYVDGVEVYKEVNHGLAD